MALRRDYPTFSICRSAFRGSNSTQTSISKKQKMFRRLPFRKLAGNRCIWTDGVYGPDLFSPDVRDEFPMMFPPPPFRHRRIKRNFLNRKSLTLKRKIHHRVTSMKEMRGRNRNGATGILGMESLANQNRPPSVKPRRRIPRNRRSPRQLNRARRAVLCHQLVLLV